MDKGIPCEKCLEVFRGKLFFAAISVLKRRNTTEKMGSGNRSLGKFAELIYSEWHTQYMGLSKNRVHSQL